MGNKLLISNLLLVLCLTGGFSEHSHRAFKRTSEEATNARQNPAEITNDYWMNQAQATLRSKLGLDSNRKETKPKNIIFFLGDGMSIQTSSAARVHAGGNEKHNLAFDTFPHVGLSKTYCTNRQVPDSAATGTAYLTGVKTNYGLVGVDSNVRRYNCEDHANPSYHVKKSISDWAMDAGKAAGFVTTTRVTHASPSPLYAYSANRYWESDVDMAADCDPSQLEDIAEQLVFGERGKKLKVVLGGGRSRFLPNTTRDEEGFLGMREDGKNLIADWQNIHKEMGSNKYVWNREQLLQINPKETDYLLGLFAENYMGYDYEAKEDPLEPSLSDMTEMAIKMVQHEEKGYFLFIEGGRIDTAHHDTFARTAIDETRAFSDAIELAVRMTSAQDTLIVVSADHAHSLTYNGYQSRSKDIFGVAENSDRDKLPYTTLSYINGPGAANTYGSVYGERADVETHDLSSFDFRYYGHIPLSTSAHSADDVGVYATGPQSHLFVGAYEQNALPYLMAYAAEIGPYASGVIARASYSLILFLVILLAVHNFY